MLKALKKPTLRHLDGAQVVAFLGAALALGLLARKLAREQFGSGLGPAQAIKMIDQVTLAQMATAEAERLPHRVFPASLNLFRAAVIVSRVLDDRSIRSSQ